MANIYTDNPEIKFHMQHELMKRIVELKERGFEDKDKYDYAPQNFEDAMDNYDRTLDIVGDVTSNVVAPNAEEVDAEGPHCENGRVRYASKTYENLDATIKAGDVTQADMFKLYRFENLMFMLRMTGEEIRKHLEFSYDRWCNTMTSPEDHALRLNDASKEDQQQIGFQHYTFNFDSAAGIDYEVDLTKPDGQKVRILKMSNGQPFDEKKWYKVVMNSYRANGGGELLTRGAGIPKDSLDSRVIWNTELDQRHYLAEEIHRQGTINPQPNHNWRFVPEEWAKPALERDRKILFGQ